MEKQVKEILNRIKKINKGIQKSQLIKKDKGNDKLLEKTMITLEKILKYLNKK